MAAPHRMFTMCAVSMLLATALAQPVLSEADDDAMYASLLSASKAFPAVPARRNLAIADPASCAMDVSAGVADLAQVGLGMWSAVKICKTAPHGSETNKIACTADVLGVVSSLTNVGQYIIGALESCAGVVKLSDTCSRNSLILAGAISGGAGSSTALSAGCASVNAFKESSRNQAFNGASCIIDMRSSMQGLLKIIMSLVAVKQQCSISPEHCASSTAHIVASLANLAKFALSAAGDCAGQVPTGAACGLDIASLVASLSTTASAATNVELACNPNAPTHAPPAVNVVVQTDGTIALPSGTMTGSQASVIAEMRANISNFQRLYRTPSQEALDLDETRQMPFSSTTVLAGFIPLMAIMGFLAGKRAGGGGKEQRRTPICAE